MRNEIADSMVFNSLDDYFSYREGSIASTLSSLQNAAWDDLSICEPGRILFIAEIGSALNKLTRRQQHAVLRWYWAMKVYADAETARRFSRHNVLGIQLSKRSNSKNLQKKFLGLLHRYQEKAISQMRILSKDRAYQEGMDELIRLFREAYRPKKLN
jgi:hypothetical protein